MKRIFLALCLLPLASFAQTKGDTKITAVPSDTTRLFSKLITLLYTEDYIVKVEDSAHGIIVTEPKTIDANMRPQVRLKLFVHDSTVQVSGDVMPGVDISFGSVKYNATFEPIQNKGGKGSLYRTSWEEMERVAKIIGSVSYSK